MRGMMPRPIVIPTIYRTVTVIHDGEPYTTTAIIRIDADGMADTSTNYRDEGTYRFADGTVLRITVGTSQNYGYIYINGKEEACEKDSGGFRYFYTLKSNVTITLTGYRAYIVEE